MNNLEAVEKYLSKNAVVRFKKNTPKELNYLRKDAELDTIAGAFIWDLAPEGYEYWNKQHIKYRKNFNNQ